MTAASDFPGIDRNLGWIFSVGGAALFLAQLPLSLPGLEDYPTWWNIGVATLVAMILLFAIVGRALPYRLLRISWQIAPVIGAFLMLTTFSGYRGGYPLEALPWILTIDAVLTTYLMLWLKPWAAAAGTVIYATLVPLSALAFLGSVPELLLVAMPIHMANIIFIAMFVGIRRQMIARQRAQQLSEHRLASQARAAIEAEHHEHLARMLHDEVLSVLTAAFRTQGTPSPQLQFEAGSALNLLNSPLNPPGHGSVSCELALNRITHNAQRIDPSCAVTGTHHDGQIPQAVLDTVLGAASEAIRNSVSHAGSAATREIQAQVTPGLVRVRIVDDGVGFDPELVHPEALGVRQSIVARMGALPGGSCQITSSARTSTTVELLWQG